ncbi:MAG: hypothetical protein HC920_02295 [Oscillatoriales cyanobacterium SM2_3_0]|nr:hypothetical protein [Oscillatoriales cyanobacterium SM2_3_0]
MAIAPLLSFPILSAPVQSWVPIQNSNPETPLELQVRLESSQQFLFPSQPGEFVQLAPQPPSLSPLPELESPVSPSPTETSPLETSPPEPQPLQPSPEPIQIPGTIPQTTVVREFEVTGSTVFTPEDFAAIAQPFINRPISLVELYQLRSAITQLYVDAGYINSGAFIPPQELTQGVVRIQVIEGGLEAINISGTRRLRPGYIRSRLNRAIKSPPQHQPHFRSPATATTRPVNRKYFWGSYRQPPSGIEYSRHYGS